MKWSGVEILLMIFLFPFSLIYIPIKKKNAQKTNQQSYNPSNVKYPNTNTNPVNVNIAQLQNENQRLRNQLKNTQAQLNSVLKKSGSKPPIYSTRDNSNDAVKISKQQQTALNKLKRLTELYRSVEYSINAFFVSDPTVTQFKLSDATMAEIDELVPSVILNLHSMDVKDLRKAFKQNDKQIQSLFTAYAARYTTKSNQAIYKLMVIALRSELQNILIDLRYEKLDVAIEKVKAMTSKYLAIAGAGNQSIAGTLTKFIGQVEYLFINAVKIEYNYYVKKEQVRQEQQAIREQMRLEAQERKALAEEAKKLTAEESKYTNEISRLNQQIKTANAEEAEILSARIKQLEDQISELAVKKENIVKLQNGKAGNIYIISNLGSFGDDVFKIGMTRRADPQERVDELGSASVPFKFDVHSFIFSEDAVGLENKLHTILNSKRLNKVNLRKEFFKVSLDELEELVTKIDPTAEFTRTMAAEEFRQSLSSDEVYTSTYHDESFDDDDE